MEIPEYNQSEYYTSAGQLTPERRVSGEVKGEQFVVEEFFDFSNDHDNNVILTEPGEDVFDAGVNGNSTESSSVTVVTDGVYRNFTDGNDFSEDLCLPYDLAEFEWLSNLEEETFSSEDLQKLQLISGIKARPDGTPLETRHYQPESKIFRPQIPVPGKARTKRSRAAPGNWTSRLQVLTTSTSSEPSYTIPMFTTTGKKTLKVESRNKDGDVPWSSDGRKCLHCATDKTPQWRTGPMGQKTLCNACGVRYKSGRLVPEYRPAASPTFILTKHSNSHRKVLEMRRQKEMEESQQQLQYLPHHHHQMFIDDDEHSRQKFLVPHF